MLRKLICFPLDIDLRNELKAAIVLMIMKPGNKAKILFLNWESLLKLLKIMAPETFICPGAVTRPGALSLGTYQENSYFTILIFLDATCNHTFWIQDFHLHCNPLTTFGWCVLNFIYLTSYGKETSMHVTCCQVPHRTCFLPFFFSSIHLTLVCFIYPITTIAYENNSPHFKFVYHQLNGHHEHKQQWMALWNHKRESYRINIPLSFILYVWMGQLM